MARKRPPPKRTRTGTRRKPGPPPPAQEAPDEARARLEYVLATNPVVIYSLRWREGRVTPLWISDSVERVLGYSVEEAMSHEWWLTGVHPEDRATTMGVAATLGTSPQVAYEYRFRHKDGTYRWLRDELRGEPAADGKGVDLIGAWLDVTAQHTAQQQLRQAQKLEAVGQLTAGIVHDFNNMLSVVIASADLIAAAAPRELAELAEDVGHIKRAAQGGAELVKKLLSFSRQAELTIVPTDLKPVVRDVQTMLARIVPPNVAVRLEVREPLPWARADGGAVQQILLNLATNARDAMPQGGTLTIELGPATAGEKGVVLEVTDTGMGMDEATQARIFEPFFTTKPPGKGTGLGMPMILGLVQQHGGQVDVRSRVGAGTTVRITLPVAKQAPVAAAGAPGAARGGSETVLLVDDEPALRRTGKRILQAFGYTVIAAADGEEALRIFDERRAGIALVVSDLEMPKLGGLELWRQLRERGSAVPFVCASGFGALQLQEREALPPDVSCIQKPWTMEEFARAVRAALDAGLATTTP